MRGHQRETIEHIYTLLWAASLHSVQFSCSVMPDSLRPHGLQHPRPPCPSPAPRVYSNSCPLSQWCHPTISSCHPLLLQPSIFPSIRVFSNESALRIRWPKYWSFSFNISSSNEHPGLLSVRMIWLDLISSYLFSVAGWPMRKEQWLRARLSLSPSELPGSGGTSYSCDLLGPWESLNSSPFS